MKLKAELEELQNGLATIDLLTRPSRGGDAFEYLVLKLEAIAIRMDGNKNHKRPHLHVDYRKERHVASYAIDTGERLVGSLDRKYDREVAEWIEKHRDKLLELWNVTQTGADPKPFIATLAAGKG